MSIADGSLQSSVVCKANKISNGQHLACIET